MSNKTQLQTNNTTLDGYIARINTAKDIAASLPNAGSEGGSGANFKTSIVTLSTPVYCNYLGLDFQRKQETTSSFEAIKNSIIYVVGRVVDGSGYSQLERIQLATGNILQLTDTTVNITVQLNSSAD